VEIKPGQILQGEYKVISVLQELEYSTVLKAISIQTGMELAVKEVRLRFEDEEEKKVAFSRFEQVAHVIMEIRHPYLARIIDFFHEEGREYVVMEFVPGWRLQQAIDETNSPFGERYILQLGVMVASALECLHEHRPRVIFADLNPSNIILCPDYTLKLTDFGMGKLVARRNASEPLFGTRGYAPPEQYGLPVHFDEKMDIYAIGAVLFQLCTLVNPAGVQGELPPVRAFNPHISPALEDLILRATRHDPKERYASARAIREDLTILLARARLGEAEKEPSFLSAERPSPRRQWGLDGPAPGRTTSGRSKIWERFRAR